MTMTATLVDIVDQEFAGPWREDVPVFGCCRNTVREAVLRIEIDEVRELTGVERAVLLTQHVVETLPGQLETHACCRRHLANLAFDLPDLAEAMA